MSQNKVRVIHIEDEKGARDSMATILSKFVPQAELVGTAVSISQGMVLINTTEFEVLFLDLHLPDGSGFELIDGIPDLARKTILTTADDTQGIKALKSGVLDYIVKPLSIKEMQMTFTKVSRLDISATIEEEMDVFKGRIAIPDINGVELLDLKNIVRFESDRNYTRIHLEDGSEKYVSKTLGVFSKSLDRSGFIRVHKSHLVNVDFISRINKVDRGSVELLDGTVIKLTPASKKLILTEFYHLIGKK